MLSVEILGVNCETNDAVAVAPRTLKMTLYVTESVTFVKALRERKEGGEKERGDLRRGVAASLRQTLMGQTETTKQTCSDSLTLTYQPLPGPTNRLHGMGL